MNCGPGLGREVETETAAHTALVDARLLWSWGRNRVCEVERRTPLLPLTEPNFL